MSPYPHSTAPLLPGGRRSRAATRGRRARRGSGSPARRPGRRRRGPGGCRSRSCRRAGGRAGRRPAPSVMAPVQDRPNTWVGHRAAGAAHPQAQEPRPRRRDGRQRAGRAGLHGAHRPGRLGGDADGAHAVAAPDADHRARHGGVEVEVLVRVDVVERQARGRVGGELRLHLAGELAPHAGRKEQRGAEARRVAAEPPVRPDEVRHLRRAAGPGGPRRGRGAGRRAASGCAARWLDRLGGGGRPPPSGSRR